MRGLLLLGGGALLLWWLSGRAAAAAETRVQTTSSSSQSTTPPDEVVLSPVVFTMPGPIMCSVRVLPGQPFVPCNFGGGNPKFPKGGGWRPVVAL